MLGREAARAGGVTQSATTWFALAELSEQPLRLGELARRIGVSQPAASALLRTLTPREWVEVAEDTSDGRAKLLRLTASGHAELARWRSRAAERLAEVLGDVQPVEEDALRRAHAIISRRRGQIEKSR